jgi:type I restriction enzyme S subunit
VVEWSAKTVGEVCEIKPPKVEARRKLSGKELVSFVPMENLGIDSKYFVPKQSKPLATVSSSYTYFANGDVLLAKITPCFENGKLGIARNLLNDIGFGSSEFVVLRPNATVTNEWLYYFLSRRAFREEGANRMSGAVGHKRVAKDFIEGCPIPVPPIPEQKRIVGILDEALDAIATAKANAEKNARNARALFESHLQAIFTQRGDGWVEKKLGEVCGITSTLVDPRKKEFLNLVHVGAGNIESHTGVLVELKTAREEELVSGKFLFDESMVLYSKIRPYLRKVVRPHFDGLCSADIYPLAPLQNRITRDYLYHLLMSEHFTEYAVQGSARAGMPKVNREHLFRFHLWLPPIKTQAELTTKLDILALETRRLERIYRQKIDALEELKEVLLHRAFMGQLTKQSAEPIHQMFPIRIAGITPTDLHAGILGMAYQLHEKHGKQTSFGRVKAEKIAHMVEAFVGIDLERSPVKDAAGPSDFPHLVRVEHRARKAGFFSFTRVEGSAYRVTKYRGFDALLERTRQALGPHAARVDNLLKLMLPMSTQHAEVVSTVYAAWNNLLLQRASITDETIVSEARENWHQAKLAIPRQNFFSTIRWMRKKNLTPLGRGKRVGSRTEEKQ